MARLSLMVLLALVPIVIVASAVSWPHPTPLARAPLLEGAHLDDSVRGILLRSCADCHSEATHYPWYGFIAPVSWLLQADIDRGREHLNFSRWNSYPPVRRVRALTGIANQVMEGEMPLWQYTLVHRDAKLSEKEIEAIFSWTQGERERLMRDSLAH